MELELKHLSAYLPYNVNLKSNEGRISSVMTGIQYPYIECTLEHNIADHVSNFSLILRPLSDLAKEIEVNGEKFVPIIELYKLSNQYNYNDEIDYEFIDSGGACKILKVFHNREKEEYTEFIYNDFSFRKETRINKGSFCFGIIMPHAIMYHDEILNQYKMQNLLHRCHFDIFGLIEAGLAVDINTVF